MAGVRRAHGRRGGAAQRRCRSGATGPRARSRAACCWPASSTSSSSRCSRPLAGMAPPPAPARPAAGDRLRLRRHDAAARARRRARRAAGSRTAGRGRRPRRTRRRRVLRRPLRAAAQAPAYRGGLERTDTVRLERDIYRACVPSATRRAGCACSSTPTSPRPASPATPTAPRTTCTASAVASDASGARPRRPGAVQRHWATFYRSRSAERAPGCSQIRPPSPGERRR